MKRLLFVHPFCRGMRALLFSLAALAWCIAPAQAQEQPVRCWTTEHTKALLAKNPELRLQMERLEHYANTAVQDRQSAGATVIIPVVFHVMHNGDAVGSNENIGDAAIMAQIQQLNEDYRRLNTDAGRTPSVFQGVAADSRIEFCLAQTDPNGNATTGIDRIDIGTLSTSVSTGDCWEDSYIDSRIKGPTIWNSNLYLNIWTVQKIDQVDDKGKCKSTLLGYAQFPGLGASTDGVVLRYNTIGSIAQPFAGGSPYDRGRTATHEIGHWLNLRHIWGDDSDAADVCSGSDGVGDTPNQGTEHYGCPAFPTVSCSNGPNGDMFMNYMDYVNDSCMNMFTTDQASRMQSAITAFRPGIVNAQCGNCPNTLNLTPTAPGDLTSGSVEFDAGVEVRASNTIRSGARAEYQAGNRVILEPQFWAKPGSDFWAHIEMCTAPKPENNREAAAGQDGGTAPSPVTLSAYPNPVNDRLAVRFTLPEPLAVQLVLRDMFGRSLYRWYNNEVLESGEHTVEYGTGNLPPGSYFLVLVAGKDQKTSVVVKVQD